MFTIGPPLVPILNQTSQLYILPSYFCMISFNIIPLYPLHLPGGFLPSCFPFRICQAFFFFPSSAIVEIVQPYSSSLSPGELHPGLTDLRVEWDHITLHSLFAGNDLFRVSTVLDAFTKWRQATVSFVTSVLSSVLNNSVPTSRIFMKFDIWVFCENLLRKFKFH